MQRVNAYASAPIDGASACHITLATDKMADADDVLRLRGAMEHVISPLFPCQFRLGNFTMLGGGKQIAAYKCHPVNPEVANALSAFYAQNYRGIPGTRLYPSLKLHVTVDSRVKLEQIEAFQHGPTKGVFIVGRPTLMTRPSRFQPPPPQALVPGGKLQVCGTCARLPFAEAVGCTHLASPIFEEPLAPSQPPYAPDSYAAPPYDFIQPPSAPLAVKRARMSERMSESPQWKCKACGWDNNMSKKECRNRDCNEWRPRHLAPQPPSRPGDWRCAGCNDLQFAKNTHCRSCGKQK